jgi:hypothetical protein
MLMLNAGRLLVTVEVPCWNAERRLERVGVVEIELGARWKREFGEKSGWGRWRKAR